MPTAAKSFPTLDAYFRANPDRTHEWLAEQLGVDRSYVTMLRNRERTASLELAIAIRDLVGVEVDGLVAVN